MQKKLYAPVSPDVEKVGKAVLDAAYKVHTALGPGLLESVYETCTAFELTEMGLNAETQSALPVTYRGIKMDAGLRPDMIVLTGDYISQERGYAAPCAEIVGRLTATHGVFAILGNHDHWTDAKLITDLFAAEDIRMLINEGVRIDVRDHAFWLAGVDDTMVGLEDLPL